MSYSTIAGRDAGLRASDAPAAPGRAVIDELDAVRRLEQAGQVRVTQPLVKRSVRPGHRRTTIALRDRDWFAQM
jgi:hypothetical protein